MIKKGGGALDNMNDLILIISGFIAVVSWHVFGFYAMGDTMGHLNKVKDRSYWDEVNKGIYMSLALFIPSAIVFILRL